MQFNKVKIGDIIVFLIFLAICSFSLLANNRNQGTERYLVITAEETEWIYPLDEDQVLEFSGPVGKTIVTIENGNARITESDCPNQLCIAMGAASKPGQWAACLPNRVFLSISGKNDEKENEVDVYLF